MEREPPKRVYSNNRLKQKTQLKGDEEAIIPGKFQRLDAEEANKNCQVVMSTSDAARQGILGIPPKYNYVKRKQATVHSHNAHKHNRTTAEESQVPVEMDSAEKVKKFLVSSSFNPIRDGGSIDQETQLPHAESYQAKEFFEGCCAATSESFEELVVDCPSILASAQSAKDKAMGRLRMLAAQRVALLNETPYQPDVESVTSDPTSVERFSTSAFLSYKQETFQKPSEPVPPIPLTTPAWLRNPPTNRRFLNPNYLNPGGFLPRSNNRDDSSSATPAEHFRPFFVQPPRGSLPRNVAYSSGDSF